MTDETSGERPRDPEVAWLLARERGQAAAAPSGELERAHDRLAAALAALPAVPSEPGWQDRILARVDGATPDGVVPLRPRRPRTGRWVAVAAPALAAAAAVALWLGRDPRRADPDLLSVTVRAGEAPRRGGDPATVGDVLEASAPAGAELRVYRGDHALVVRCPGAATCSTSATAVQVAWPLNAPGRYRAVALSGSAVPAVSTSGDLDADLAAAARAGVRVTVGPTIDVE